MVAHLRQEILNDPTGGGNEFNGYSKFGYTSCDYPTGKQDTCGKYLDLIPAVLIRRETVKKLVEDYIDENVPQSEQKTHLASIEEWIIQLDQSRRKNHMDAVRVYLGGEPTSKKGILLLPDHNHLSGSQEAVNPDPPPMPPKALPI